jgi:hypothetical protein
MKGGRLGRGCFEWGIPVLAPRCDHVVASVWEVVGLVEEGG